MKVMETYGASGANMCSNEQIDFFKNLISILVCLQMVSDEETLWFWQALFILLYRVK